MLCTVFLWGKQKFQRLISQLLSNEFSFLFCFKRQIDPFPIEFIDSHKHGRYLFVQGEHLTKVTFLIIKQH